MDLLVSIPDRDYGMEMKRRKRPSSVEEISIPERETKVLGNLYSGSRLNCGS
jgi:hypothetical protein